MDAVLFGRKSLSGKVRVPGDKSISHRAIMIGSIARGISSIRGLSKSLDVRATLDAFRSIGIKISNEEDDTEIDGAGLSGFERMGEGKRFEIDCRNSGTTARLLTGLFSGAGFNAVLTGDASLKRRPMERVTRPLEEHGALIETRNGLLPVVLKGGKLLPIRYTLPVASAQVKSSLLLASLFIDGMSVIIEPVETRDHTERMLLLCDAEIKIKNTTRGREIYIKGRRELSALRMSIPGDISSAVFFIAAALTCPGSELVIENVGLNPTRAYIIEIFRRMGGDIDVELEEEFPEPVGKLRVRYSVLRGIKIGGTEIPLIIDEIPALAACAISADGDTVVSGAAELRVKESDRIRGIANLVRSFGGVVEEFKDGFRIKGPIEPIAADVYSSGDHRLAMAASIIALRVEGKSLIRDAECVDVSFPGFFNILESCAEKCR
ncbi:MAG: 3-phosphoshikimate 1-carboxyvinyltransferase [Spirochaetota bacterium]